MHCKVSAVVFSGVVSKLEFHQPYHNDAIFPTHDHPSQGRRQVCKSGWAGMLLSAYYYANILALIDLLLRKTVL